MKAKILAVAVAGMLVGCGSGSGSVEFQSQKGEPEALVVDEFQYQEALKPSINEVPEADMSRYGLVQEEKPEFTGPVNGESLVQADLNPYAQNGSSLIQEQYAYAEHTSKGPSLIQEQRVYAEAESKGQSLVQFQDAYVEQADNGDPALNEVEELAICQREGLQEQETCQTALNLIETGISEAKGEFDKNPQTFQLQSKAIVDTAENGIKRQTKRDATYPEVIEFLVNSTLEEDTFENRYAAAGYAIATYYYVRGIPEGHTKTGNPGLCADKGYCGDQYLKYQWN